MAKMATSAITPVAKMNAAYVAVFIDMGLWKKSLKLL